MAERQAARVPQATAVSTEERWVQAMVFNIVLTVDDSELAEWQRNRSTIVQVFLNLRKQYSGFPRKS